MGKRNEQLGNFFRAHYDWSKVGGANGDENAISMDSTWLHSVGCGRQGLLAESKWNTAKFEGKPYGAV